jgi:SAM-dependent methyltransferase
MDPAPGQAAEALMAAWAARVRANREQAERIREAPDDGDFYAPVSALFAADPYRSDDATLDALAEIARPDETWLDIGAGAGRFALPLALRVGEVIAVDPSAGMLDVLSDGMRRHGIRNVRLINARWPMDPTAGAPRAARAAPAAGLVPSADVVLIAHLGYDVEAIGDFLDAMEAAAGRLCVAVLAERVPSSPAGPFWPVVHGERRVVLPALGEFLAILRARGREPAVQMERRHARGFASQAALLAWLRNQLFVVAGSAADGRLVGELGRRIVTGEDGSVRLVPEIDSRVGVARWLPRT